MIPLPIHIRTCCMTPDLTPLSLRGASVVSLPWLQGLVCYNYQKKEVWCLHLGNFQLFLLQRASQAAVCEIHLVCFVSGHSQLAFLDICNLIFVFTCNQIGSCWQSTKSKSQLNISPDTCLNEHVSVTLLLLCLNSVRVV